MKIPPFYISSRGHSATVWLTADFSKHPEIVCFHGTRTILPKGSGTVPDMTPEQFIDTLLTYSESSYGKTFGAIHGFYDFYLSNIENHVDYDDINILSDSYMKKAIEIFDSSRVTKMNYKKRETQIFEYVQNNSSCTQNDIQKALKFKQVNNFLNNLIKKGEVSRIGKGFVNDPFIYYVE